MKKITICKSIISQIREWLDSDEWLENYKVTNHFVRKRKLSMRQLIIYLFYAYLKSMDLTLDLIEDDLQKLKFPNISKQAVSKARAGIKPELFRAFFRYSVEQFYKNAKRKKTWRGYHLFAIDGSTLELPVTDSNELFYGTHYEFKSGKKYTMARISLLYDINEDMIVDGIIDHDKTSERDSAMKHLIRLNSLGIKDKAIIIVDRGYFSEKLYRYLVNNGYLCLFRIKKQFRIARKTEKDDETILLDMRYPVEKTPVEVRIIKVAIENDHENIEYLATNVFDPELTPALFKELYFERWNIEGKYYELKNQHYIEEFAGATPIAIMQEFFLKILASNLAALIKSDADDVIKKDLTDKEYQANRSYIIGRLRRFLPLFFIHSRSIKVIGEILKNAIKKRSLIRRNRKFKRRREKGPKQKHHKNRKLN